MNRVGRGAEGKVRQKIYSTLRDSFTENRGEMRLSISWKPEF